MRSKYKTTAEKERRRLRWAKTRTLMVNLAITIFAVVLIGSIILDYKFNDGGLVQEVVVNINKVVDSQFIETSINFNDQLSLEADIFSDYKLEMITYAPTNAKETQGSIEVYSNYTKKTKLMDSIEAYNVLTITSPSIKIKNYKGNEKDIIVVESQYDQSIGAYTKSNVLTAYMGFKNKLVKIWSSVAYTESMWNTAWGLPSSARMPNEQRAIQVSTDLEKFESTGDWLRLREENEVSFLQNSVDGEYAIPQISMISSQEYQKFDSAKNDFVTEKNRKVEKLYIWNEKWQSFIVGEATVYGDKITVSEYPSPGGKIWEIKSGIKVAVLEEEAGCVEALVWQGPYMVKIKLENGDICFIREDFLQK